jgi:hypothetical protein
MKHRVSCVPGCVLSAEDRSAAAAGGSGLDGTGSPREQPSRELALQICGLHQHFRKTKTGVAAVQADADRVLSA